MYHSKALELFFYGVLATFKRRDWSLSLKYHLIKPSEEWVDDSQHAFPKVECPPLTLFLSPALVPLP